MPPINNTLEKILKEFEENSKDYSDPNGSAGLLVSKELIISIISHVYQTAVEESKKVALESVPETIEKISLSYYPSTLGGLWKDCRSQTLTNLEDNFKKLV